MESILVFFSNNWIVGILSGILSGLGTQFILSRFNNYRKLKQMLEANKVLIEILKPYIAEKGLPSKSVIKSLIESIARKYNIKRENMYSIDDICEELIREVMEDIYLPIENKYEYIEQLQIYKGSSSDSDNKNSLKEIIITERYKSNDIKRLSLINASICIFITIGTLFTKENFYETRFTDISLIIEILAFLTVIIALLLMIVYNKNKYFKR
ncbi:hypothetical protein [uncultured Phascolarctobacterium sp.]|uniref:hypothetical protein n=1 Tax=uncultured Phascolarctobacterium sp. TaxID=512296 RepID=UPI0025CE8902|nr:hypothetical protein [uncultured Phascolarctobacterium sp.]